MGYGDLDPSATGRKLFTVAYIVLGLGTLVAFLSAVARNALEFRIERQSGKGTNSADESETS